MRLWHQLWHAWRRGTAPPRRHRWQHRRGGGGPNHHRRSPHSFGRPPLQGLRRFFTRPSGPRLMHGRTIAYHGTPSIENARSIAKHGFAVGGGNALGDGVYLATDLATAKAHSGSTGVYLKCLVVLGRTCFWGPTVQARYAAWCQARGVRQDNSAITACLLQHGYQTLQNGKVIVVLAPQFANPTAWKRKDHRIRVLSIHRAADDRRIYV